MAICPLKLAHSEHSLLPSRATTVSITEAGSRFASRAASSAIRWYPSIFSSPSLSRQEWAWSSPVRNDEHVPRTGRRHEKQRPPPCFMVCGCNRVIVFRIQIERHVLGVDPHQDHHGELQPFDSVHRSQSNPGSLSLLVEQRARNSQTIQHRLVVVFQELIGPGHDADVLWRAAHDQFLGPLPYVFQLGWASLEVMDFWFRPSQQGLVARFVLPLPVEIINLDPFEHRHRPRSDLLGRAIVDPQSARSTLDIDPACFKGDLLPVDPLMCVPDEEEVVRSGWDHRPEQPPLLGVEVL